MGLGDVLDKAGGAIDKASSALDAVTGMGGAGGGAAANNSKAREPKDYKADESLDFGSKLNNAPVGKDSPQGNKPNQINDSLTEFVHFSQVHADKGSRFPHSSFDPSTAKQMPEGHAIIFRDALQREAVLFHGFVSSCLLVVKEVTENQGGMEQLANMAGSLLGGGDAEATKPDLNQLKTFIGEIKSSADKIKSDPVTYQNIHDAGKAFHETRLKYTAFCQSLNAFYLKTPKETIAEKSTKGVLGSLGIGKWITVIMRYAFKLQDLYLATFLQLIQDHERSLELAAHKITIAALKDDYKTYTLSFPVWYKKPDGQAAPPISGGSNPVTSEIDKLESKADSVKKDIYKFLGKEGGPADTPGSGILGEIFSNLRGAAKDTSDPTKPPTAADSIVTALNATLEDIGGLPEIMKTVVTKVTETNLGLLEELYRRLMAGGMDGEINAAMMLECGRRHLSNLVVDIAMTYFKELTGGKVPMGANVQGMNLNADDFLKKQVNEHFSKYTEPILKIAIGDLAGQMDASRKKAVAENANTMEVLLGRLPWFTALMFRNTFFPIWNLVVEEVFGAVAPPLKSALKAVNDPLKNARKEVDKIEEDKRKAKEAKDKYDQEGVKAGTDSNVGDYQNIINDKSHEQARQAEVDAADAKEKELDDFYKANDKDADFPVTGRQAKAQGEKVKQKIPSVLPDAAAAVPTGN